MSEPLYHPRAWFDEWLQRSGERPPDFTQMRAMPGLPPLLELADGRPVRTAEDWQQRRAELRGLLEHWFWGTIPRERPALREGRVVAEIPARREEPLTPTLSLGERQPGPQGAVERQIELTFDLEPPVTITIRTLTPDGPGPFPVFLTQPSHPSWAAIGLSRGYLCCIYPADDVEDKCDLFLPAYPECDWARIPRRAWVAGLALDYLFTLPEVNRQQVAISGHSRNGKQAMIAAILDERITAVVSSSSGSGGATPFRYASEREYLESVEFITWLAPEWFHPRLRFFTGREQFLPVDSHAYLGLLAPRPCLISTAHNDGCEGTFGAEMGYLAGREVYRFLGQPDNLRIRWRPGGHETRGVDIQAYFDWFDRAFGRTPEGEEPLTPALSPGERERRDLFPEVLLHCFDRSAWAAAQGQGDQVEQALTPALSRGERGEDAVRWALGREPASQPAWGLMGGGEPNDDSALLHRSGVPEGIGRRRLHFSEYVPADLYYPAGAAGPLPVVVWLHPYCYPMGYQGAYAVEHDTYRGYQVYLHLARAGFAVFTYDQLGFGRRLLEGTDFYRRYPRWSKLGKLVHDVRAAVDLLAAPKLAGLAGEEMPALDPARIYCLGYALGGMVGLYATALDERIAGVASFCGLNPLRADTGATTGGLRRWTETFGLLPRLAAYEGREGELPYDMADVLGLIAPRPCLVVSPQSDRDADAEQVVACVETARPAWGEHGERLTHLAPPDYNRFQPAQFAVAEEWLKRL